MDTSDCECRKPYVYGKSVHCLFLKFYYNYTKNENQQLFIKEQKYKYKAVKEGYYGEGKR